MVFSKLTLSVIAACAMTLLSGCVSNSSSSSSVQADPRLSNKEANAADSSYVTSCLVGAAAVGATCLFIADKDKKAVCIAAAAAGCAAGLAGNALLEHIRGNYKTKEEQLNASIDILETNNRKAMTFAENSQKVYQEEKKELANVQKQIKQGTADKAKIQTMVAQYDANIELMKANIEKHESNLADYKKLRTDIVGNGSSLTDAERKALAAYDKQIKTLQREIEDIRSVYLGYVQDRDVLNLALSKMETEAAA